MIIKVIVILVIVLIFFIYQIYFKKFFKVKKVHSQLKGFLDVRDTLVLKLVPEINDDKMGERIVKFIDERKENFNTSYNNSIMSDIKLNRELRKFYEKINEIKKNDVSNNIFSKIINLEKDLKKIRNEYNKVVESYNNNLVKHRFICLRIIRMKPLDTYRIMGQ